MRWILKPVNGQGGKGITYHRDMATLTATFAPCPPAKANAAANRAAAGAVALKDQYLVQEYLTKPLLLGGTKFDMRVYMIISSVNPLMVWYHPGYLRRALAPYSADSGDPRAHLTNTHFQYKSKEFRFKNHLWPMYLLTEEQAKEQPATLRRHLAEEGITGPHFVTSVLEPRMKRVLKFVALSARDKLHARRGAFQVFGMDFMVDAAFNVYLIEANGYVRSPRTPPLI